MFWVMVAMCCFVAAVAGYGVTKEIIRKDAIAHCVSFKKEDESVCRTVAFICLIFPPFLLAMFAIRRHFLSTEKYQKNLSEHNRKKVFCFKIIN